MLSLYAFAKITLAHLLFVCALSQDISSPPSELSKAAREMQAYINSMPEPHQTDWKAYFDWETWGPQLASNQLPKRTALEEINSRFYGVSEGLDYPAILKMRTVLRQFLDATAAPAEIGAHPALIIRFNQKMIIPELEKLTRSRVDQRDTGNWIVGAWVTGNVTIQSNVSARLAPYGDAAAIQVRVNGTMHNPHTIAHNGAFQVHGAANSQFEGVAYLFMDKNLVRMSEPQFTAHTQSQLSHVDGPRLLTGIAYRKAQQRQSQGESEGEQIIASSASKEFKGELSQKVDLANAQLTDQGPYHVLLKRADLVPTLITTGLSPRAVQVGLQFPGGVSKHAPPPRDIAEDSDFEIHAHESLLSSFTGNFLRGSWWTDQSFMRIQKELTGTNANELLIGATPERWSVRWDWRQPMFEKCTSEHIEYHMEFSQGRIDDRSIDHGLVVKARVRPKATRWGLEFRRLGDVEVSAQKTGESLPPDVAEFFKKKFSALFGETVFLDGLSPPAGGGWDGLAAYSIVGVRLDDGWFAINCRKTASLEKPNQ